MYTTNTAPSFTLVQKHYPKLNLRRIGCLWMVEQKVKSYGGEADDKGSYTEVVLESDLWQYKECLLPVW